MPLFRSAVMVSALALAAGFGAPARLAAQEAAAEEGPVTVTVSPPVDSGAYLAGRSAEAHGDFREAAVWFARALAVDPQNPLILDGAIFAELNLGQLESAAEKAGRSWRWAPTASWPTSP